MIRVTFMAMVWYEQHGNALESTERDGLWVTVRFSTGQRVASHWSDQMLAALPFFTLFRQTVVQALLALGGSHA